MDTTVAISSIVSVRVNANERALLEAAAEQAHTSLSDFVRRKAMEAAETEMLHRSTVSIPAVDWEAFEGWLDRPATPNPALTRLLQTKPVWEG